MKRKEEKDYFERFGFIKVPKEFEKTIWIHCASVGEVRSVSNLVNLIRKKSPDTSIVITTTTYSGKEIAVKDLKPDLAFLMPLENSMAISMLIDILKCKVMLIVDTELWPNTIYTASKKTKLFMVNARLSDRSFKSYKLFKFIFKSLLNKFDYIFAKSEDDVKKIAYIKGSSDNIENAGNLKFYFEKKENVENLYPVFEGKKIAMASCTHKTEEEFFLRSIKNNIEDFDYIFIAPRHLKRIVYVKSILKKENLDFSLLSEEDFNTKIIIIDKFGMLEMFYQLSEKIFIGGSIKKIGGHNIFEAIQFEKVPAVGPYMHNFKEIYEIAEKYNAVVTVKNDKELAEYLKAESFDADFDGFMQEIEKKNKTNEKVFNYIKSFLDD
jgi:3-deoxy-D-manno-octulosonic-acid transferase